MKKPEHCSNAVFANSINPQKWIPANLTRQLPETSNRGNKYLFVIYDYNSNSIFVRPMKARTYREFPRVFQDLHENLITWGLKSAYIHLFNRSSQSALHEKVVELRIIPPGMNWPNLAEKVISTFKDYFIAVLWSTDPDLSMDNWHHLFQQAVITLNILRHSRLNPRMSEYE